MTDLFDIAITNITNKMREDGADAAKRMAMDYQRNIGLDAHNALLEARAAIAKAEDK